MRVIDMADFIGMESVNLYKVFAMNQVWRNGRCFVMEKPRPTSAFLWFCGCCGTFRASSGYTVEAEKGSLIYIPQGERYELEFSECDGKPSTVLVEFALSDGEAFVLSERIHKINMDADYTRIVNLLEKMVWEYSLPQKSALRLKSDMYGLLSLVCEAEAYRHLDKKGFHTIKKGIEYLQKDDKQELSVEELAKMCFVSPAYFRKVFKEYSGCTPTEYRTRRKTERARELMERTYMSVEEMADLLGYSDPSYFCRVFKREVGLSPSEYRKIIKKK